MALTDQDKRDLLGLISDLGDAASKARAQELLNSSEESVEFVRETTAIKRAFQPPSDQDVLSELSETELTNVTKAILNRAERIRDHHAIHGPRRTRQLFAIAACIAILVLPSLWIFSTYRNPVLGNVVFIPLKSKLQVSEGRESGPDVVKGSVVQTHNKLAVISLSNGQRITLDVMSHVRVDKMDQVELMEGGMLAEAPHSMNIILSEAHVRLEGAKAVIEKMSQGWSCDLSYGRVNIKINHRDYKILPGQRAVWSRTDPTVSILQLDRPRPSRMETATQPME